MTIFKIAYRNILLQKKQSLFIGGTIFIATLLMLACSSILNGAEKQILNTYLNLKGGEVIVAWREVMEESSMSPEKFLYMDSPLIDREENFNNKKSIATLNNYLEEHRNQVEAYFYNIRCRGAIIFEDVEDVACSIYSMNEANEAWVLRTGAIKISQGSLLSEDGVCMSQQKADSLGIKLGDEVTVKVVDVEKIEKKLRLNVTGIYENKADYENFYIFVSEDAAHKLSGYRRDEYDIARIYLKEDKEIQAFTKELQTLLYEQGNVLCASDYTEASIFFTQLEGLLKAFYDLFFAFLVMLIAIGLSATMHMKLFERMEEFGTLRAIGYSKLKCYGTIFFEVSLVAFLGAISSILIVSAVIWFIGIEGIYVGTGAMTYALGGSYIYPFLKLQDVLIAFIVTSVFSLGATLKPSEKILFQKITDIMARRQKRIHPILVVLHELKLTITRGISKKRCEIEIKENR